MKIDTHTHFLPLKTSYPDWKHISLYLENAVNSNIGVVCYTEHLDAINYGDLLKEIFVSNKLQGTNLGDGIIKLDNGLTLSAGAEVSLKGGADVGIHTEVSTLLQLSTEKGFYTLESLVDALDKLTKNFIVVAHHLFKPGKWIDMIEEKAHYLDAVELPAKDIKQVAKYLGIAKNLSKPMVAGSDSHTWLQVGVGNTVVTDNNYFLNGFNLMEFKDAISSFKVGTQISPEASKIVDLSTMYRKNFLLS